MMKSNAPAVKRVLIDLSDGYDSDSENAALLSGLLGVRADIQNLVISGFDGVNSPPLEGHIYGRKAPDILGVATDSPEHPLFHASFGKDCGDNEKPSLAIYDKDNLSKKTDAINEWLIKTRSALIAIVTLKS